jgi:ankyrin repeat protein
LIFLLNNKQLLDEILQYKPKVYALDQYGNSLLHYAALYNQTDIIQILIDANLDIIQINKEGLEPLHAAVLGDSLECFEMLLEARGRKRNYPDYILKRTRQGHTCLHLAVKYTSREVFYHILT